MHRLRGTMGSRCSIFYQREEFTHIVKSCWTQEPKERLLLLCAVYDYACCCCFTLPQNEMLQFFSSHNQFHYTKRYYSHFVNLDDYWRKTVYQKLLYYQSWQHHLVMFSLHNSACMFVITAKSCPGNYHRSKFEYFCRSVCGGILSAL